MSLVTLSKIDNFDKVRAFKPSQVNENVLLTVKRLHETEEIEPWIQGVLNDTNSTPHGPSEIADIITQKLTVRGVEGVAAFILKGRSFAVVRPSHVSHQILRLKRIKQLSTAVFAASGNILDECKEHFISICDEIGCNYAILDANDLARIFLAYGFICPRDGIKLNGGRCECGYTPQVRTSNILQQEALKELTYSHEAGHKAGAVILPTGAGKTAVAAADVARQNPETCYYIAHSHEILEDAETEFLRHFDRSRLVRFKSGFDPSNISHINFVTIQSLYRNIDKIQYKDNTYMIIDEFHHAAAKSYQSVIRKIQPKFMLGLTATPFRSDRKDVISLCDGNVIVNYELRFGIERGILCPYHYYGCFDNIDYSNITHNGNRYDVNDLEKALIIPERDSAIIEKWREKAENRPTLAFCCSHNHADRVAEAFNSAGVSAESYLSSTPYGARAEILSRFRSGDLKVICAVDAVNEGINIPFAECLLFLRPTESRRVFLQQLGRGLRHSVGKEYCVVIDFIGNFRNAYRIVEYQGLEPDEHGDQSDSGRFVSSKERFSHPANCVVEFDERVLDIFGDQTLSPAYATRHNIGKILFYRFEKLEKSLGRRPTKKDVDRFDLLDSSLYELVFRSWRDFEKRYYGE